MQKFLKMNKINWLVLGAAAVILSSCGGSTEPEEEKVEEKVIKECYYTYNPANSKMTWTAYKFTEKTPVSGTFNEVNIEGAEVLNDPIALLEGLSFSIPIATINTQNPERDEKIKNSFFGVLENTSVLTGKVQSLKDDGKAEVVMTINNREKVVEGTYTLAEGDFKFMATVDLAAFEALNGVEELNKICHDLHIGADGVSKLWEVIDVSFETKLNMDCN